MKYLLKKTFKDGKKSLVLLTAISIHLILFLIAGSTIIFKWVDSLDEVKFDSHKQIHISKIPQKTIVKKNYKKIKPMEIRYIPVKKNVQIPDIIIPEISDDIIPSIDEIQIEKEEVKEFLTEDIILFEDDLFSSLNLTTNVIPIYQPEPIYPEELSRRSIEGEVIVQFSINPDGLTHEIEIIKSSNFGFNRSVVQAIKKWKYPSSNEFKEIRVPINFKLNWYSYFFKFD